MTVAELQDLIAMQINALNHQIAQMRTEPESYQRNYELAWAIDKHEQLDFTWRMNNMVISEIGAVPAVADMMN